MKMPLDDSFDSNPFSRIATDFPSFAKEPPPRPKPAQSSQAVRPTFHVCGTHYSCAIGLVGLFTRQTRVQREIAEGECGFHRKLQT